MLYFVFLLILLILIFIRIHCEYQISDSLEKMVSNLKENVDPDFVLMNGEVKLRDREMENLSSVVLHRSFPPLNTEVNSVMGEFYTVLSKVLKTLDTVEITEMGFPTDVMDRLTSLIDLEEQTFLRNRGLFSCNDSMEDLVLDMFRTDTICDTNFEIPPLKKV